MIFDEFLSGSEREAVFAHCNDDDYRVVHAQKWQKVWRLADGFPLQGTTSTYAPPRNDGTDSSALDIFAYRIMEVLEEIEPIVGNPSEWNEVVPVV